MLIREVFIQDTPSSSVGSDSHQYLTGRGVICLFRDYKSNPGVFG